MSTTNAPDAPVALHIPAILQNPSNRSARAVEAHNAQQREKAQARREARAATASSGFGGGDGKKGKRVLRRIDNAAFASNPHIVAPTRADYAPPVPLRYRAPQPSFPAGTLPRSAPIPPAALPEKNPYSTNSVNGTFSTSLKGTRALLRKRGRRAEQLVGIVEGQVRGWLGGEYALAPALHHAGSDSGSGSGSSETETEWRVIDETLVDGPGADTDSTSAGTAGGSTSRSRRMPVQHQITSPLPALPQMHIDRQKQKQLPAILELSRSPAHLSWYVADSFERLVTHLVCRYYELVSWSEQHSTTLGESVRLTHVILPNVVRPKASLPSQSLLTPETSELSGQSSSEPEHDTLSLQNVSETDSETPTERGDGESDSDIESVEGYSLDADTTVMPLSESVQELSLGLQRTESNTSSRYASSEGGSEWDSTLGDSLVLPPPPGPLGGGVSPGVSSRVGDDDFRFGGGSASVHREVNTGGWIEFDSGSEIDFPPRPANLATSGTGTAVAAHTLKAEIRAAATSQVQRRGNGRLSWEEKPTFFEFLYGA